MTDELTIEGKQYVSSKRAAEISRYAQDYVGQLARGGLIDAQRVGGLWYVQMESLLKYKEKAESYVPQPPQHIYSGNISDALVSFDGKDYVSASRAADITGYHQDYVGQLAREGKILSRQIGNRWYVDREGLLKHKEEKDDLLGAVQAQAVGIQDVKSDDMAAYERKIEALEPLSYTTDNSALMPTLKEQEDKVAEQPWLEATKALPIRIVGTRQVVGRAIPQKVVKNQQKIVRKSRKMVFYGAVSVVSLAALLMLSIGSFKYFSQSATNQAGSSSTITGTSKPLPGYGVFKAIGDALEPYITRELIYKKYKK